MFEELQVDSAALLLSHGLYPGLNASRSVCRSGSVRCASGVGVSKGYSVYLTQLTGVNKIFDARQIDDIVELLYARK
jgi:hypothetical protein